MVLYTTSRAYHAEAERGARWDDPALGIEWPIKVGVVVSEKDAGWPDLEV
jgi:dTDP-4-dehydrorhamnose 3,5-epimerase